MLRTCTRLITTLFILFALSNASYAGDASSTPAEVPIDTHSAGRGGPIAMQSVLRLTCPETNSSGTSFLHRSGKLITAAHVVRGCPRPLILLPNGKTLVGHVDASDDDLDIALIGTDTKIPGTPLLISPDNSLQVGAQVSTWGYPSGYSGRSPMLSVGYLSGADDKTASNSGDVIRKWAVNAAFNAGNSGGPLLQVETGEVIGVVSSKLAPISPQAQSLLQALEAQRSGLSYSVKMQDGSIRQVSESQAVAEILKDLREQVQLVIGYAVTTGELREFLRKHGVEP